MVTQLANKFFNFDGYNILILGGNSGFGFEILKSFSPYKNQIYVVGRSLKKINKVENFIKKKYKRKIFTFSTDLKNEDDVKDLFNNLKNKTNKIDIVINCIGINIRNPIDKLTYKDWNTVINTNLNIPFLISKYSLNFLKKSKKPRMINFTSIFSTVSFEDRTPYASSKGALLMLTKTLALEWAKYGITVNSIAPGPFLTELNKPILQNKKKYEEFCRRIPMKRFGNPEEIITSVMFLSSKYSSYITGSNILIDGGWTSK